MNEQEELTAHLQQLFREDDTVSLLLRLDTLTANAIQQWRSTKGGTADQITEVREKHLQPTIIQLGWICLEAIRFHHPIVYQEGLERLARIYDLGRIRELGTAQQEIHSQWTTPSKQVFAQLYFVGCYATFRQRYSEIGAILKLKTRGSHRRNHYRLLSHPLSDTQRGGNNAEKCFDDALKQLVGETVLFGLFFNDKMDATEMFCQFDLIVSYSLWRQNARYEANFLRYGMQLTSPIVEFLIEHDISSAIFGAFETDKYAEFLRLITGRSLYGGRSSWDYDDWSEPIKEFLKQHPKTEGER